MLTLSRAGRIMAGLLLGIAVLTSFGCSSAPPVAEKVSVSPRRAASINEIRATPKYKSAKAAFSKGNRAEAKRILVSLSHNPGLSDSEKQFIQTQIAICDGGKKLPTVESPRTITIPQRIVDCGPRALAIAAERLGTKANLEKLRKEAGTQGDGTSLAGLEKAAKSIGLKAESLQVDKAALAQLEMPAVAWLDGDHFVALLGVNRDSARLHDPNDSKEKDMPLTELLARSGGIVLTLQKT